jgi:hypothetical protein
VVFPAVSADLQVHLYDFSHQPNWTLKKAQQVASRVFAEGGVNLVWTLGDGSDPQAHTVDFTPAEYCPSMPRRGYLNVRLTRTTPESVPTATLGVAYPCSKTGVQVSIYVDHVEALAPQIPISVPMILGYALVHEIGHMLLQSGAHSTNGLMKACWSKSDLRAAMFYRLHFEADEVARIRQSLSEQVAVDLRQHNP